MNEPQHSQAADAPAAPPADVGALIASLRAAGADRFDPVGWRYIEALAGRASAHEGETKRLLDARLAQVLAAFNDRFDVARNDAGNIVERNAQQYPHAAEDLRRHFAAGDFKGVKRLVASLESSKAGTLLGALVRQLEQQSADHAETQPDRHAISHPELKTIRNFRSTWSKLSVENQVTKALEQAPKNAGPINSHMLVLRSLALMRDISPDYLNRFMSYADTLLCLDQGEKEKPATSKKQPATRAVKK